MSVIAFKKPDPIDGKNELVAGVRPPAADWPPADEKTYDFGLKRTIYSGSAIVAIFIVGFGLWASLAPLSGAVIANGFVRVEESRKVVKNRDGGIVSKVLVRDGQHVVEGEVLIRMDNVQARSAFEVYDNQILNLLARRARFLAESRDAEVIDFPDQLQARLIEPTVAQLIDDQKVLFETRRLAMGTQVDILNQRIQQLNTRIGGYEVQIASIVRQQELIEEEKSAIATLLAKGLAPKSQVLALERASVDLGGQIGSLRSQIAEARENQGEATMEVTRLRQDRLTESNQGLSDSQSELTNILPRLESARATLALTEVRAPSTGIVIGLTQFTDGGVVGAGERILDIVPDKTQLIIEVMVQPQDIAKLEPQQIAMVKLTAYNQSVTPSVEGKVLRISADRLTREDGTAYFTADVAVDPATLAHLAQDIRLYPGMPAEVIVPTGERTALEYILSPISNSMDRAFREE